MGTHRTIYGIRVVEWAELDEVLFELERSAKGTGGIEGCLSEPIALEALEYLADLERRKVADLADSVA